MRVKAVNVRFDSKGWIHIRSALSPSGERFLVELRGVSGRESWWCGTITMPADRVDIERWGESVTSIRLLDGVYKVDTILDRRGKEVVRFFADDGGKWDYLAFVVDGFVDEDVSEKVMVLAKAEGWSRTRKNGDRMSLVVAPPGAVLAVVPYEAVDPIYYLCDEDGPKLIGSTDIVLPPDEW